MSGNLVICHDIYCTPNHKHSHRSIIFSSGKISVQEKEQYEGNQYIYLIIFHVIF